MLVSEAAGAVLTGLGADTVFGVVGSGNFHVTNALIARGARFVAARHEGGAACMADGWARISGRPGILSVHQGPGLTNAMTGITEAAKSRTPLLVLAADVAEAAIRSNFRIDVDGLARAVGAVPARLHSPDFAVDDTVRAYRTAVEDRRTVILALPLDVQTGQCPAPPAELLAAARPRASGSTKAITGSTRDQARGPGARAHLLRDSMAPGAPARLADAIRQAERPVFIAGRGARNAGARADLERLADACGALLATSAAAKGLFRGNPWDLDISGGFASPLAAELIRGADLVVGWGCALNMWTMRHGALISPGTVVAQVDDTPEALGAHRDLTFGVLGDVEETAIALASRLSPARRTGYRTHEVRRRLEEGIGWATVPYDDLTGNGLIDPRALSRDLDALLPPDRVVAVDSGNFMGYPSAYLGVRDHRSFCFTQAFQSIGLGLATAIG